MSKFKKESKKHIIYSSNPYDFNEEEMKESWYESAEVNDWEIPEDGPSDDQIWEEWNFQNELNWRDIEMEVKFRNERGSYLVVGTLELWRGPAEGGKIIDGYLTDVLKQCFEDYNKVYWQDKNLKVSAVHHDGTNHFIIKKLTDRGIEFYNNHYYDYDDRTMHQKLFKDAHYTHSVDFFARIYGWIKNRKEVK